MGGYAFQILLRDIGFLGAGEPLRIEQVRKFKIGCQLSLAIQVKRRGQPSKAGKPLNFFDNQNSISGEHAEALGSLIGIQGEQGH